ncbi:MAG: hypothetical protein LBI80_01865 [Endomicrobium sp.]|jgi:hypothetical protein|nr:hypothetical protein [Endomicrobium sp.]
MENKEVKEKKCFSKWNSWFSPIGLAILVLSCSTSILFLSFAIAVIKSIIISK